LTPGPHVVEVRLGVNDAIQLDNVRRNLVVVDSSFAIALFGASETSTRYLQLAAKQNQAGEFDLQTFGLDKIQTTELGRYDVWAICDPEPLSTQARNRINQHLSRGGGVIWWLGPNWSSQNGDDNIATASDEIAWDAWGAIDVRNLPGDQAPALDPLDYKSPLVSAFEPFPGSGLLTLPVFRYWSLRLGDGWEPALVISNPDQPGESEVLIASLDRSTRRVSNDEQATLSGREVIVATPPGPATQNEDSGPWNAIIAWPAFVPLVQEMFQWAGTSQAALTTFTIGERLSGETEEADMGTRLVGSQGNILSVDIGSRSGSRVRWSAGVAEKSGVYRWADGSSGGQAVLVVNVDPSEGDLTPVETIPETIKLIASDELKSNLSESSDTESGQGRGAETSNNRDVGWWFLLTAVGLLITESSLVRWLESRF
jgi:hypothetical protein